MNRTENNNNNLLKLSSDSIFDLLSYLIPIIYFVVILIIALSTRVTGNYGVETDFFWLYVPHAKSLLDGEIAIDSFHGPIYPLFLGLFFLVFKDFLISGIVLSAISASTVIYFSYRIISRIADRIIALIVILFLAINPIFIQYSYTSGTDMFFNAIITITIFYFLNNEKLIVRKALTLGLLTGIAYMTRNNAIFLLLTGLLIFFTSGPIQVREKILLSLAFYISFILTNLPWNLYCYFVGDTFLNNTNYLNIAFEMYNKGSLNREDFWFGENKFQSFWDVISYNPLVFLKTYLTNIYENFRKDLENFLGWQLGVFFIAGMLFKLRTTINRKQIKYLLFNLSYFLVLAFVFYNERFSLFLIPFYLFFSLFVFLSEDLSLIKLWPKDLVYLIVGVLFIWTFIGSVEYNRIMINFGPKDLLKIKDRFEQTFIGDTKELVIASRKPYVAYQLGLKFQIIPMADSTHEFLRKLREKKVDFLYWGNDEITSRKHITFPVDPDSLKMLGLERLFTLEDKSTLYHFRGYSVK